IKSLQFSAEVETQQLRAVGSPPGRLLNISRADRSIQSWQFIHSHLGGSSYSTRKISTKHPRGCGNPARDPFSRIISCLATFLRPNRAVLLFPESKDLSRKPSPRFTRQTTCLPVSTDSGYRRSFVLGETLELEERMMSVIIVLRMISSPGGPNLLHLAKVFPNVATPHQNLT
ncbi:hypothetical protein J6590_094359, partial [Homalodisca vitripennis]